VRDVTDSDFDSTVLAAGRPVVVDFWAPWCGPCKAVAPVLEQLAEAHRGVDFVKLDIDANPDVASRFGVLSIPTVILFEGGEARDTLVGARPKSHYERAFSAWLDSAPPKTP
jgi:thioredoxin 1